MDQTKPARRRDPFDEAPDTQFYWAGAARATPLAEVEAAIERGNFAIRQDHVSRQARRAPRHCRCAVHSS
jgi:hypothetical protein